MFKSVLKNSLINNPIEIATKTAQWVDKNIE